MNEPERAMFDHSVQAVRELNEAASKLGAEYPYVQAYDASTMLGTTYSC